MSKIICQCGDAIQPDDDALCGTCAMDFHDNKRTIERLKRENANLKTEIVKLQADNISLVEQMNQMALKPNQEVIDWHSYIEKKPTETDCRNATIIPSCVGVVIKYKKSECEKPRIGVDTYWFDFPKSGKAMFESQFDPTVIILAWAYLPKGVTND